MSQSQLKQPLPLPSATLVAARLEWLGLYQPKKLLHLFHSHELLKTVRPEADRAHNLSQDINPMEREEWRMHFLAPAREEIPEISEEMEKLVREAIDQTMENYWSILSMSQRREKLKQK